MVTGPGAAAGAKAAALTARREPGSRETLELAAMPMAAAFRLRLRDEDAARDGHAAAGASADALAVPIPLIAAPAPQRIDAPAAVAPPAPPSAPPAPSSTLLALAREPGALPRQWQLEISAHAHAAPLTLNAQRQPAGAGLLTGGGVQATWSVQVGLPANAMPTSLRGMAPGAAAAIPPSAMPAITAAQFDRLAARLARHGVTAGSLQVSIDAPRSTIGRRHGDPFDEKSNDDATADRR